MIGRREPHHRNRNTIYSTEDLGSEDIFREYANNNEMYGSTIFLRQFHQHFIDSGT
jgi:hypothetical protein